MINILIYHFTILVYCCSNFIPTENFMPFFLGLVSKSICNLLALRMTVCAAVCHVTLIHSFQPQFQCLFPFNLFIAF